jgi:DNA-binding protein HU-beta
VRHEKDLAGEPRAFLSVAAKETWARLIRILAARADDGSPAVCLTTRKVLISIDFRVVEGAVIKLDLVNAIVQKTNISRSKAEQAVETVFEAMKNALGRGERIELRRFGVFNVKPRKTGIGRNPRTGQQVNIPPGKAVRFKPGKELQALPAAASKP